MRTTGIDQQSCFAEAFVKHNRLDNALFSAFSFDPCMLFGSRHEWWAERRKRRSPHEGIDICCFLDQAGRENSLPAGSKVPTAFVGKVIRIVEDYLGKSVFIEHDIYEHGYRLVTIYAHIVTEAELEPGVYVNEGDVIGRIADTLQRKSSSPPHLHLSAAWFAPGVSEEDLSWETISYQKDIKLIDPLKLIPNTIIKSGQ